MREKTLTRYMANGILATIVHYGILVLCLDVINIASAGIASIYASLFGIVSSFLGNKYFVFRDFSKQFFRQSIRFFILYTVFSCIHGIILYLWSDVLGKSYHHGFCLATFAQFSLGYIVSRNLIFEKAA